MENKFKDEIEWLAKWLDTDLANKLEADAIPFRELILIQICNRLEELIELLKVRTYGK